MVAEVLKVGFQHSVHAFSLAVGLWVINCGELLVYFPEFAELFQERVNKLPSTV